MQSAPTEDMSPIKKKSKSEGLGFGSYLKQKEGLYSNLDGKEKDYQDRIADQEEITKFLDEVFEEREYLTLDLYEYINTTISSEMFYSTLSLMYKKLPCAKNFFHVKQRYRAQKR